MLAEGLDLKGLSLCLFPLIFSYNRSKRIMFESEEALADYTAILLMILTINSYKNQNPTFLSVLNLPFLKQD